MTTNVSREKIFFPKKVERLNTTQKSCKICGRTSKHSKNNKKR